MKIQNYIMVLVISVCAGFLLPPGVTRADDSTELEYLRGLALASSLSISEFGRAALATNLAVTGAIQNGTAGQPTLLPFAEQQQLALRDALATDENAHQLADGLGTLLGEAYQELAQYGRNGDGEIVYTNASPAMADLIAFTSSVTASDSTFAKSFLANGTADLQTPAPAEAMLVLKEVRGVTDSFGKAYGLPAGSKDGNYFGNPRPFQTETHLVTFSGKDFFGTESDNLAWLRGPEADLVDSPSYPSGHATYGYAESLLLALLVPERYPEMMVRAAEYGNNRIIMGAHYAMDVIAGRTLATYDMAQLLANKANFIGVERDGVFVADFRRLLTAARSDLRAKLAGACGHSVAECSRVDQSRFADPNDNMRFFGSTLTYGLPVVSTPPATAGDSVGELAPEAGYLLTAAYPYLSLDQANEILTATLAPRGGFLDDGSRFGVYSRLNLYGAAREAIAAAPK